MFHTICYRGCYIHLAYDKGGERIQAQLMRSDGSYVLVDAETFIGAKHRISRYLRECR